MTSALIQKLAGVRDLKRILETTVKELAESFSADTCQILLSNPLDPNVTSICEYRTSGIEGGQLVGSRFPLILPGKALGQLSLARQAVVSAEEINAIRAVLLELSDIIRQAQINDIVQRDTFRDTFLIEIGNVMSYSLGIGDALFMVVNILGKVLQSSRCIFICTDDTQAGWKCYEFWQQDKVQSCQEYCWPTRDSPIVAQALLANAPLLLQEGQPNSYVTPVQEELQFLGVKSLLGVPLRSELSTHGCVILQQCDHRRDWTRGDIDMVQSVADKLAESLVKLPAEKLAREPIMQLHQRTVVLPDNGAGATIQSVRAALKGALGQQAIPMARKTSAPPAAALAEPSAPPLKGNGSSNTAQASPEVMDFAADHLMMPTSAETPSLSASTVGQPSAEVIKSPVGQIDSPPAHPVASPWGNLDSIASPSSGPVKGGLGSVINVKGKGPQPTSPLLASLHKDKSRFEPARAEYVSGPPLKIDEAAAQAKFQQILSSSNPTSDYIFSTPGLDTPMLARIDGWISQIETRDKYAKGHAWPVAEYATAIAVHCGLSQPEINTVRLAALVHDVGKLGTAAQILQKKDEELTDAELLLMMKHPLDGAELLDSFPELRSLADIVRAHHEEWTGNGYPSGLKGEEIPLAARIIGVANSYHALTSTMKYGPGMDPARAQEALRQESGQQWEPRLVEALLVTIQQGQVPAVFNS